MALTDLSRVTQTLTALLSQALARDTNVGTIEFSAAPPDDTTGTMPNIVSVYLFHAIEDPHGKNWTPAGAASAAAPVQHTPLALVLNYIITVNSSVTDEGASARALIEQRLMGFVARALHEFPVIDDDTVVPAVPPAPPNPPLLETTGLRGAGNTIQIILRPLSIDEAVNFWSAEQDRLARFSLFVEVRVILFETPRQEGSAPPVLSVADFVTVMDRTTILRARSLMGFALPPGHPLADPVSPFRFAEVSPARPALFPPGAAPASVPPRNNRVTFEGAGFQGERVSLSLAGPVAEGAAAPETRNFRISVSQPVNPEWEIDGDGVRISVSVRSAVTDETGTVLTLYPGLYRVRVIVGTQIAGQGQPRYLERSSADCAIAVVPQIATVTHLGGPAAARQFRITLHGAYLRDDLDVMLTVAGRTLARDAATTVAGNFDFSETTPDRIDFAVDTTAFGSPLPVHLLVNDAEAAPAWGVF